MVLFWPFSSTFRILYIYLYIVVDPFSTAKQLIQQSRDKNIASNYGLIIGTNLIVFGLVLTCREDFEKRFDLYMYIIIYVSLYN